MNTISSCEENSENENVEPLSKPKAKVHNAERRLSQTAPYSPLKENARNTILSEDDGNSDVETFDFGAKIASQQQQQLISSSQVV